MNLSRRHMLSALAGGALMGALPLSFAQGASVVQRFILPNGLRVVLAPLRLGPSVYVTTRLDMGLLPLIAPEAFEAVAQAKIHAHPEVNPRGMASTMALRGCLSETHRDGAALTYRDRGPSHQLPALIWAAAGRFVKAAEGGSHSLQPLKSVDKALHVAEKILFTPLLPPANLSSVEPDLSAFFSTNNGVLSIVGDFDLRLARRLVEKHFEALSRGAIQPPLRLLPPGKRLVKTLRMQPGQDGAGGQALAYLLPRQDLRQAVGHALLLSVLKGVKSGRLGSEALAPAAFFRAFEGQIYHYPGHSLFYGFDYAQNMPEERAERHDMAEWAEALVEMGLSQQALTYFQGQGQRSQGAYADYDRLLGLGALFENTPTAFLDLGVDMQLSDARALFGVALDQIQQGSRVGVHVERMADTTRLKNP